VILDELLEEIAPKLRQRRIARAAVGVAYTGVILDDGTCGVAATLREGGRCPLIPEAGRLEGMEATEVAAWALGPHPLKASLGMATINACLSREAPEEALDPLDVLPRGLGTVGMVGYFGPLVGPLRERTGEFLVFERNPDRMAPGVLPDWMAERELPRCELVLITGTAFTNKTIDHLLSLCRGEVWLVGPTSPLWPGLARHGVSWVFGAVAADPERVLTALSQAGGTRILFRNGLHKRALRLKSPGQST